MDTRFNTSGNLSPVRTRYVTRSRRSSGSIGGGLGCLSNTVRARVMPDLRAGAAGALLLGDRLPIDSCLAACAFDELIETEVVRSRSQARPLKTYSSNNFPVRGKVSAVRL